jgi:hypothetical protein
VLCAPGNVCSVRQNNANYARGAFDFLAAYVIPEDVWYIIPAKKLAGRGYVTLCSDSEEANFEEYREAWHLLREATGLEEESVEEPLLAKSENSEAPPESGTRDESPAAEMPMGTVVQADAERV